jgi:hypothetical protein
MYQLLISCSTEGTVVNRRRNGTEGKKKVKAALPVLTPLNQVCIVEWKLCPLGHSLPYTHWKGGSAGLRANLDAVAKTKKYCSGL